MPLSARLAATASLMANSTEAARNRGYMYCHRLYRKTLLFFITIIHCQVDNTVSKSVHKVLPIICILLNETQLFTLEEKMACGLLVPSISVTFSSTGMSEQAGIL